MTQTLTLERLLEVLHYEPITGAWTWLKMVSWRAPKGASAGFLKKDGYRYIGLDGKEYKSSRLAHFYMSGEWPKSLIDHEDLDRSNDRWTNLREATRTQNGANVPLKSNNSSGLKGVSWHSITKKWRAQIQISGRNHYLGLFITPEAAHAAYMAAAEKHFGEFARAA